MLIRIDCSQPLVPAYDVLPGRGSEPVAAHRIMSAVRDLRRPVFEPATGMVTGLAAAVPVRLPATGVGRELSLLGEWEVNRAAPSALWLTDLTTADPSALIRLTRLVQRVDEDFDRIADQVGIRDYSGRSFDGWHRHVTLASAAHAVASFAGRSNTDRELRYTS
jgi:SRSO17 transposase